MAENTFHTIVVGGGIAGLTAATYLAKAGHKVLLVEKNKECGGLVSTFSRNGFHFEAGIRALENAGIIFPMLEELDIQLDVVKSQVSVGLEEDILPIEDVGSLEDYQKLLEKHYPESEAEIGKLMRIIRKVMKTMDVLYGIENPNFKDLKADRSFLFRQLLPWLPKFLLTIAKINRMNMPVEQYLDKLLNNPSLRDIISQHFFKNTPTFFALSYFSLYLDYFYPKGGVGKLAEAVEQKFLELGGEIAYETTIARVQAADHLVMDTKNVHYSYDHLVWAADLKTFYQLTDPAGYSNKILRRFNERKKEYSTRRGGDSVYTLYLQVDEPADSFRKISNGHFFYTPSKQGLGETHWTELDKLIAKSAEKTQVLAWLDNYISLNTFEISIPVLKDPGMAPEGKTGVIISILTEYDLFHMISEAGWYKEFITELEVRIIKALADTIYPMFANKVERCFSFSPLSYANRVGSTQGAITGWSFQESVPVINQIQQANRAVTTPLPSIYQAGQWTYSPSGVPISILTGKLAARKILNS